MALIEFGFFRSAYWFLGDILHITTFSQYLMRIVQDFTTITPKNYSLLLLFRTVSISATKTFVFLKLYDLIYDLSSFPFFLVL